MRQKKENKKWNKKPFVLFGWIWLQEIKVSLASTQWPSQPSNSSFVRHSFLCASRIFFEMKARDWAFLESCWKLFLSRNAGICPTAFVLSRFAQRFMIFRAITGLMIFKIASVNICSVFGKPPSAKRLSAHWIHFVISISMSKQTESRKSILA